MEIEEITKYRVHEREFTNKHEAEQYAKTHELNEEFFTQHQEELDKLVRKITSNIKSMDSDKDSLSPSGIKYSRTEIQYMIKEFMFDNAETLIPILEKARRT